MRPRTLRFLVPIVVVTVALSTGAAFGQLGPHTESSLEWLVAKAEVVVRGSVVNVVREPDTESSGWDIVTLQVREALKGGKAKRLNVAIRTLDSDNILYRWKETKQEALWFLDRPKMENGEEARRLAKILQRHRTDLWTSHPAQSAIRLGVPASASEESRSPPPIFTLDLRLLDQPEDIVNAARKAVNSEEKWPIRVYAMSLPHTIMRRIGTSGDGNYLRVPVDRRLEAFARRLIVSPEDFQLTTRELRLKDEKGRQLHEDGRQAEKDSLRSEGVRVLRYFKSRENIALLKPLLKDESWWIVPSFDDRRDAKRFYYIREAAYETLRQWGVEVGKPVLREDLSRKNKAK